VRVVLTPFQAPNANAYAERFVRSIREECLDHPILFGERRLLRALDEFAEHYHKERNHQGLGNDLIVPARRSGRGGPRSMRGTVGRAIVVLPRGLSPVRFFEHCGSMTFAGPRTSRTRSASLCAWSSTL
jgi:transposase InsO family protein